MQVTKITLWDGRKFYTDDFSRERLRTFFNNVRARYADKAPADAVNQVDLIEMTPEEYAAIPATMESASLFGDASSHGDSHDG